MKISKVSQFSGNLNTREIDVDPGIYGIWNEHGSYLGQRFVQDIFPHLSADDREFLMTGVTPEEWDEAFPPEEEDDPDFLAWIEDEEADYTDYPSDYESDLWDNDGARYDFDGFRF